MRVQFKQLVLGAAKVSPTRFWIILGVPDMSRRILTLFVLALVAVFAIAACDSGEASSGDAPGAYTVAAAEAVELIEAGERVVIDVRSPAEFAEAFVAEWGLALAPEDFLARFRGWIAGPHEGALELLEALESRFTLACLSNTSEAHWEVMMEDYGLAGRFHRCFGSHRIGMTKPDPAVFRWVAAELGREVDFASRGGETELDRTLVETIADRVATLYLGRLVELAPTPAIFSNSPATCSTTPASGVVAGCRSASGRPALPAACA